MKRILLGLTALSLLIFALSWAIDALAPARWLALVVAFGAFSLFPENRVVRAAFGTAVLAGLVFFGTQIFSEKNTGAKNFDLTEDARYTLTDGTKAILSELTEPVTINYYVTRDIPGTPPDLKRYIPRVDAFLREIENLAPDDLVTVNFIDPEPNTDEEDAALLDQVQQVDVTQDDRMIFGASVSSLEKKTVIPFFDARSETQLEFNVISAIAEVTTRTQPTIGLVSAHKMATGGQSRQGWAFYQVLTRNYDVADFGMQIDDRIAPIYQERNWEDAPTYLDPEKIPLILVAHPAAITESAEFLLDQYLLRGGTIIACVDPYSIAAQQESQGQQTMPGMPPQGGVPIESNLPKLFEKHNIIFETGDVILDRKYAAPNNPGILVLTKDAMPVEDDISLSSIQNIALAMSGAFVPSDDAEKPLGAGLEVTTLVEASDDYTQVPASKLLSRQAQQELRFALQGSDSGEKNAAYILRLAGNFETAFPDGKPAKSTEGEEAAAETPEPESSEESLLTGTAEGNLYLIADSDMLYDGLAYNVQRFGQSSFMQTISGNGPFVQNLIDQAIGSKHLIGARARTPVYRSFTVLKDKQAEFEKKAGDKIEEFQKQAEEASAEINRIQAEVTNSNAAQMNSEFQAQIEKARKAQIEANRAVRNEQKSYQSEIDQLKAGIFWKTLLIVPAIVIIIGLIIFIRRRSATNAR